MVVIILAILVLALVIAGWFVFRLPQFGGSFEGARLDRMKRSPQFADGRFENNPPQGPDEWVKSIRLYFQGQVRDPRFEIPVIDVAASSLRAAPQPGLRAIWFGHASVLLEIDGVRVMTDPVFADVVSPVPPIGPRRFHRTPAALAEMTNVHAVVVSHDHYDHLDMETVQQLASRGTHFFIPLGIGAHLERWGVPAAQIHEMDWWETAQFRGITIACTPARHYSGRKRMNNSTLWSSWTIRGPQHSAFYSGDTGYAPHFAEIQRRLGSIDLAVLKVGAYGETWLDIHMDPESAVQAARDLDANVLLPVHWATFNLSYHDWDEPILRTLAAAREKNVRVITPRIGETFTFGEPFENQPWYAAQRSAPE
jgi:L-ascorbate metabolism protein UlaG (beta-lactamase superfamily)